MGPPELSPLVRYLLDAAAAATPASAVAAVLGVPVDAVDDLIEVARRHAEALEQVREVPPAS